MTLSEGPSKQPEDRTFGLFGKLLTRWGLLWLFCLVFLLFFGGPLLVGIQREAKRTVVVVLFCFLSFF